MKLTQMRLGVGVIALLFACLAQAHERSESTSHWTLVGGELHGVVTARTREVTRLTVPGDSYASLAQIFAAHVQRSVAASVDGVACTQRQAPALLESEPGYVRVDVRMRCPAGDVLALKVDLLFGVAPSHHHFLYVAAGSSSREAILSASEPSTEVELRASASGKTNFLQFVGMGIEHIATGVDHLAFLLALLITARTARQVLAIVTGFTVGHSITLSLAVLGVIQANRGAVECLIGLTIAMAAAQNLIRGEREGRVAGLAAAAIAASLLLIPADLRPDMPASLVLAIALATGSAVWLASMGRQRPAGATGIFDSGAVRDGGGVWVDSWAGVCQRAAGSASAAGDVVVVAAGIQRGRGDRAARRRGCRGGGYRHRRQAGARHPTPRRDVSRSSQRRAARSRPRLVPHPGALIPRRQVAGGPVPSRAVPRARLLASAASDFPHSTRA